MSDKPNFSQHPQIPDQSQEGESQPKYSDCPICYTDSSDSPFSTIPECNHSFCQACLQEYLNTQISSFKVLNMTCPQDGCQTILTDAFLETFLDQDTFQKYQKLLLQKLSHKGSQSLICPKSGCSKPLTPFKDSQTSTCACGSVICNVCGNLSHEGKTCLEAIDRDFEIYAQKNDLKFCVMCKTVIAKVEGCTHMTCSVCDYQWCWLCGREYNLSHDRYCPREWSPLPPKEIVQETKPQSKFGRITRLTLLICLFMILIPIKTIFWSFWVFNTWTEMLSPHRSILDKIAIVMGAIFFSIIYVGVIAIMVWLIVIFEYFFIFCFLLIVVLLTPWIFYGYIAWRDADERRKRRWISRNANNFRYTNIQRPQQNPPNQAQDNTNNNEQVQDENQVLAAVPKDHVSLNLPSSNTMNLSTMGTGDLGLYHLSSFNNNDRSQLELLHDKTLVTERKDNNTSMLAHHHTIEL